MRANVEIIPVFIELIPDRTLLEERKVYISIQHKCAVHLCLCGCNELAVTPLTNGEWTLTENDGKITLRPSIGNWSGENPYHAHYVITDNIAVFQP